ncbi:unnamed protein product [Cladocopium goreaui]|uniref:Uncharacterized protein n=1 Tax=Cladocopium goreaui TaxID=2562237 RepID=A0A9P1BXN7_9DINO|nr:unnamed protein product [Cladocopium goreaui]
MAFNPVPAQLTVHVRWPTHPDDAEFTLDSVVAGLGMSDMDCDINSLVIPASTPSHRVLTPPLELLPNSWVPWDTSLSESRRFHLVFLDRQLYADTVELANTIQATMDWVPTACAEWSHTYIELTLLNHAEMVELQELSFEAFQQSWLPLPETDLDYYFSSYARLGIHEDMLKDEVRTGSYMEAIDSSQVDVDGGKQPRISC